MDLPLRLRDANCHGPGRSVDEDIPTHLSESSAPSEDNGFSEGGGSFDSDERPDGIECSDSNEHSGGNGPSNNNESSDGNAPSDGNELSNINGASGGVENDEATPRLFTMAVSMSLRL
ncbi:hypothetical protein IWX49DRAFT_593231 [Phyllosticta citricarpa]|uniref:Uncharacterized protein n=2 Tax=Phyllosticta TaxID=121621 RepID=A0ABR1MF39_9PEZI